MNLKIKLALTATINADGTMTLAGYATKDGNKSIVGGGNFQFQLKKGEKMQADFTDGETVDVDVTLDDGFEDEEKEIDEDKTPDLTGGSKKK